MKVTFTRMIMTVAIGALAMIGIAQPAQAATTKPAQDQHCVVVVEPVKKGEHDSRIVSVSCATTEAGARTASQQATVQALAPQYNIIKFWQYYTFTGSTLTMTSSQPCYGGWFFAFPNTRPSDFGKGSWGASAWKTYNGCDHTKIFYGKNYGAPWWQYYNGTTMSANLHGLNDHVWSAETTTD